MEKIKLDKTEGKPEDEPKETPIPKIKVREEPPISRKFIVSQVQQGLDTIETLTIKNNTANYKKILAEVRRIKKIAEDL